MKREYVVIEAHRGPEHGPLELSRGDRVFVKDAYQGPEDWPDWVGCVVPGKPEAWVPLQILDKRADGTATVCEDYSSRELVAAKGDVVHEIRILNGWMWVVRPKDGSDGWIPLEKLRPRPKVR
jgi:hypothetical protein